MTNYDWRFENSISREKNYLEDLTEYASWRTNAYLSNFIDCIFYVNLINQSNIPDRWHYDFLFYSIKQKKRFAKGVKKDLDFEKNLEIVCNFYNINRKKAKEIMSILSNEQLTKIINARGEKNDQ